MAKLKVYHGCFDGSTNWMVAACSLKAAAAAMGVSFYVVKTYAHIDTCEEDEVIAFANPGIVFSAPANSLPGEDWIEGAHRYSRGGPWPPAALSTLPPEAGLSSLRPEEGRPPTTPQAERENGEGGE